MGYELCTDISFCRTKGRIVLLDLERGRYWCIAGDLAEAFSGLMKGDLPAARASSLQRLVEAGFIEAVPSDAHPAPCIPPPAPSASLCERRRRRPGFMLLAHSLARLAYAQYELRRSGLGPALNRFGARKASLLPARHGDQAREEAILGEIADTVRFGGKLIAPLDQCLPRSLALAHLALDRGLAPTLVIGVRLQPFGAHCWVQADRTLLNESIDQARNFTPILVL